MLNKAVATKARSKLLTGFAAALVGSALLVPSFTSAATASDDMTSSATTTSDCTTQRLGLHNGYTIRNLTGETLKLKSANQTREGGFGCVWGHEPPAEIAPNETVDFSVYMDTNVPLRAWFDWQDNAEVIYGAASDPSRVVTIDANVNFLIHAVDQFEHQTHVIDFAGDYSSCSTFHGMCSVKKSTGQGTQTRFDLY